MGVEDVDAPEGANTLSMDVQVVDGMVMASRERMASIGASFEDTGSTAKPFEGEEVDWYW